MNTYRAEVLGRVPHGLTHNDVYASFLSMVREADSEAVVSKRRLAGDMVSLIVSFKAEGVIEARKTLHSATTGVTGFSADTVAFRDLGA